jgi:hypothetical protein
MRFPLVGWHPPAGERQQPSKQVTRSTPFPARQPSSDWPTPQQKGVYGNLCNARVSQTARLR